MLGYEIADTTRWGRLPVYRRNVPLADVPNVLPTFSRKPFANEITKTSILML